MELQNSIWGPLGMGLIGALVGALATVVTAIINRQHPMAVLIDSRFRLLNNGHERAITDLQNDVARLEQKVDVLALSLEETRGHQGFRL